VKKPIKKKPAKKVAKKKPVRNEFTSARIARIAAKGVKTPWMLTIDEVQAVCASCLTQVRGKK
jgi:hypothetical protein